LENSKTSVFSNGLIWFGAAVSIAEILTGTIIAPLGFGKGIVAILLGHLIGCALLYFAGLIGAKTGRSAMETVKMSFGEKGSLLFAALNVLQLLGWTAVMIVASATAASTVISFGGNAFWSVVISILIIVWLLVGVKNLGKLNSIAMGALFILSIILSVVVFSGNNIVTTFTDNISFGTAVELSAIMPLSWLPLISDYTRFAKKPKAATFTSAAVYFFTSSWMYIIGMGVATFTGESDISVIMLKAGLGVAGLIIIIFATVTTTFLDVYSAGVSAVTISKKLDEKWTAIIVCAIGTLLAIFTPVDQFVDFLNLIGSVFAPMIAIQIADTFILKIDSTKKKVNVINLILWGVGFATYRVFMYIDTPVGNTLPVILITIILCVIVEKIIIKNIIGGKKNA